MKETIRTYTGRIISLPIPRPEEIHILDIAEGLGGEGRFSNQLPQTFTVAEHSINVANAAKFETHGEPNSVFLIKCLLHDASEAYIRDLPSPLKRMLPGYIEIEANFHKAIFNHFLLPDFTNEEYEIMKRVDMQQRDYERFHKPTLAQGAEATLAFLRKYVELNNAGI